MLVFEVCAFDEKYNVKKTLRITKKSKDILKEILTCFKDESKYDGISETAKDVLYIYEDEITYLFTCSLLFINAEVSVIAEHVGVSEEVVTVFKELFFNVDKFRGKIAKIGFFKRLIVSEDLKLQNLGIILKAAYNFGQDYIKWKFGLNNMSTATENILNNTFKDMYFKYLEKSYKSDEAQLAEHIRAGKQIISAAVDIQRASSMSGGSSTDDIKKYLMTLQDEAQNSNWEEELEVVDIYEHNNIKDQSNGE